ncbi:MAG: hypothetical protein E3J71_00080 [Candidatus Stahlbacteria bacterium]|nr:MAG: hypothetical protein E3J71_00080 [Candidatus Stahlbacteria bacterium]
MKLGWRIFFLTLSAAAFTAICFAPIPGMDAAARLTLAVFVLALILWVSEAIPLYITSLVIAALLSIFLPRHLPSLSAGYAAFLAPFFSPVILLFLGGFVLARGLESYDLDSVLASAILRRVARNLPAMRVKGHPESGSC